MGFLQRLFFRLGFILCLAVSIRLIGGFFSPAHPVNEVAMVEQTDRFGNTHLIPRQAMETSSLAAPLSDPEMRTALMIVQNSKGGTLGQGGGARMRFMSADGPVELTPDDIVAINAEYYRFRAAVAAGPSLDGEEGNE